MSLRRGHGLSLSDSKLDRYDKITLFYSQPAVCNVALVLSILNNDICRMYYITDCINDKEIGVIKLITNML